MRTRKQLARQREKEFLSEIRAEYRRGLPTNLKNLWKFRKNEKQAKEAHLKAFLGDYEDELV